jgi:hypothetical protein
LRSAVVAVVAVLLVAAIPAQAAPKVQESSSCAQPTLTQPFLYAGDSNSYMLAPGQTPNNFAGTGWTLSGRASIKKATIEGGTTSSVLDLPSGSQAVSPAFCVTSEYPMARMMARNVLGSGSALFYVSYRGNPSWETLKYTGRVQGEGSAWTLAAPVSMQPYNASGWLIAQITLVGGGTDSDSQFYNLYIDPYSR